MTQHDLFLLQRVERDSDSLWNTVLRPVSLHLFSQEFSFIARERERRRTDTRPYTSIRPLRSSVKPGTSLEPLPSVSTMLFFDLPQTRDQIFYSLFIWRWNNFSDNKTKKDDERRLRLSWMMWYRRLRVNWNFPCNKCKTVYLRTPTLFIEPVPPVYH